MSEKKRLNILVIDEDPLVLKSFVSLLNHEGYTAIGVSAVSRAIKLLENNPFDMVITELVMAEMSGEELLSAIIKRAPGIILIVLTIFGSLQMARLALRKGAFDYLLKPCDYKVLKESIARAVTSQKISQGEKMAEEALRASEERYRIVIENVHDLLLLFNEDRCCLYASPSWESQIGISFNRLVGKNWLHLFSMEDKKLIEQVFNSITETQEGNRKFEVSIHDQTKGKRTFIAYMLYRKDSVKQRSVVFLLLHDITERLINMAQEKEIERITAAKDLAIATAHHVNQPMTCIRGLTEIMLNARIKANSI